MGPDLWHPASTRVHVTCGLRGERRLLDGETEAQSECLGVLLRGCPWEQAEQHQDSARDFYPQAGVSPLQLSSQALNASFLALNRQASHLLTPCEPMVFA